MPDRILRIGCGGPFWGDTPERARQLMQEALGGVASLRYDPQGKGHAQTLLDFQTAVPSDWLEPGSLRA